MAWIDEVEAISLIERIITETMPRCPDPHGWAIAFGDACTHFEIVDRNELAMMMAQVGHESLDLTRTEENLNYSAGRLVEVWPHRFSTVHAAQPYAGNPKALANNVYANRMGNTREGDGWRFHGRGPVMLTGRANYESCARSAEIPCDDNPDLLLDKGPGALSACWYWRSRVSMGSVEHVTRQINGGLIGLDDRQARYDRAKALV